MPGLIKIYMCKHTHMFFQQLDADVGLLVSRLPPCSITPHGAWPPIHLMLSEVMINSHDADDNHVCNDQGLLYDPA